MKFFEDFSTSTICEHNPSGEINPLKRFFDYFFRKRSLWDHYTNTAVCYNCGEFITFPLEYTDMRQGIFYFIFSLLVSVFLGYLFMLLLEIRQIVLAIVVFVSIPAAILLIYNIMDSFVLSHYSWRCCEKENDVLLRMRHNPRNKKFFKFYIGFAACLLGLRIIVSFW